MAKRSMSRAGSILEAYWNSNHHPPRMEWYSSVRAEDPYLWSSFLFTSTSPSYGTTTPQPAQLNKLESFDLESADELGIHGHALPSRPNLGVVDVSFVKRPPCSIDVIFAE